MSAVSYFREVAQMLRWGQAGGVLMIFGYFDESNQHDQETAHTLRCVMGGCFAPAAAWQQLIPDWEEALTEAGVSEFHMADCQAGRGEFQGWDRFQKQMLVFKLLDLMAEHITGYIGTFCDVDVPGNHNRKEYTKTVMDMIRSIANHVDLRQGQKISLVFARHQSFYPQGIEAFVRSLDPKSDIFGSISTDSPKNALPLQAADLFAYEIQHHLRFSGKFRFEFKFLIEEARKRGRPVRLDLYPVVVAGVDQELDQALRRSRKRRSPERFE